MEAVGVLFAAVSVEITIGSIVFFAARARSKVCSWDLKTTQRRLCLGLVVAVLGAVLTILTWPRIFNKVNESGNGASEIAGAVGGAIGMTIADPRQWAAWLGFYWAVLATMHKGDLAKLERRS